MSHHTTHMNESCHTHMTHISPLTESFTPRVMSHMCMSHVTNMHKSCHKYEWVTSYMWMSNDTHVNESRYTYEWVISHMWISHVTHMNGSGHTYARVMAHIRTSHITYTWTVEAACHSSFTLYDFTNHIYDVTLLCHMTQSYVWYDFLCDTIICVTCMTKSYVWYDFISHITNMMVSCDTFFWVCHMT